MELLRKSIHTITLSLLFLFVSSTVALACGGGCRSYCGSYNYCNGGYSKACGCASTVQVCDPACPVNAPPPPAPAPAPAQNSNNSSSNSSSNSNPNPYCGGCVSANTSPANCAQMLAVNCYQNAGVTRTVTSVNPTATVNGGAGGTTSNGDAVGNVSVSNGNGTYTSVNTTTPINVSNPSNVASNPQVAAAVQAAISNSTNGTVLACSPGHVCAYDPGNGSMCPASGCASGASPNYIVACSCPNGQARQLVTETVTGADAASYCSSVVCATTGSQISWKGVTGTKTCEPGQTVSCVSMGTAANPGSGNVCNATGTGTTLVSSDHGCVGNTTDPSILNGTPGSCSGAIQFAGCSGTKNCYSCVGGAGSGNGKTAGYCVSEPGLSCGAQPGAVAAFTPTATVTTPSTPPSSTPPSNPPNNPTPVPTPTFVCLGISKDIDTPKYGDSVRFTCATVSTAVRYEFQYSVGTFVGTLVPTTATSNVTGPLAITKPGTYKAQCRPCTGADEASCTPWVENWTITSANASSSGTTP